MSSTRADCGERRARLELVAAGARLAQAGLLLSGEGNLSCRSESDAFLITPRGVDKGVLAAGDLVMGDVGMDGAVAGASTEMLMHRAAYRVDASITAVVHAHPPRVLALAMQGRLPQIDLLEEGEMLLGGVMLVGFAPSGSGEFAEAVARALATTPACVIERHGAVTVGGDVETALRRMLVLERLAELTLVGG